MNTAASSNTCRLTVAQAIVRFLASQYSERDGAEKRLIAGCFGIFGHGNVAGLGQALLEAELHETGALTYYQARNEQAMVHAAVAFARMNDRLSTLRLYGVGRAGRDQHVDRRGTGDHQPPSRAAVAGGHLCHSCRDPGAAGVGASRRLRRVGKRLFPPRLAFLRSCVAARTTAAGAARRHASVD